MRILVVGAGGVGSAVAAIARRRDFFEMLVLADLDQARAQAALDRVERPARMEARAVDASDADAIVALARDVGADTILNACTRG
jgi:saccharopine dehydrogenase-like NADP-dependent oxidoreductase